MSRRKDAWLTRTTNILLWILIAIVVGVLLAWKYWDILHDSDTHVLNTVRNLGILFGGFAAIVVGVWRSAVATMQAAIAHDNLLNDRYQRGVEMLGNPHSVVRLGGIHTLKFLAQEYSDVYRVQTIELLCDFIRNPTDGPDPNDESTSPDPDDGSTSPDSNGESTQQGETDLQQRTRMRDDVQVAFTAVSDLHRMGNQPIRGRSSRPGSASVDMSFADLRGVNLLDAYLHRAILNGTRLEHACLRQAILDRASLQGATLHDANLENSNLRDLNAFDVKAHRLKLGHARMESSNFTMADLSHSDLTNVKAHKAGMANAVLHDADLSSANLVSANLHGANLSNSTLCHTNLTDANLPYADFCNANLENATLDEADFGWEASTVVNLTQNQLETAKPSTKKPPKLPHGAVDCLTRLPLEWE